MNDLLHNIYFLFVTLLFIDQTLANNFVITHAFDCKLCLRQRCLHWKRYLVKGIQENQYLYPVRLLTKVAVLCLDRTQRLLLSVYHTLNLYGKLESKPLLWLV